MTGVSGMLDTTWIAVAAIQPGTGRGPEAQVTATRWASAMTTGRQHGARSRRPTNSTGPRMAGAWSIRAAAAAANSPGGSMPGGKAVITACSRRAMDATRSPRLPAACRSKPADQALRSVSAAASIMPGSILMGSSSPSFVPGSTVFNTDLSVSSSIGRAKPPASRATRASTERTRKPWSARRAAFNRASAIANRPWTTTARRRGIPSDLDLRLRATSWIAVLRSSLVGCGYWGERLCPGGGNPISEIGDFRLHLVPAQPRSRLRWPGAEPTVR